MIFFFLKNVSLDIEHIIKSCLTKELRPSSIFQFFVGFCVVLARQMDVAKITDFGSLINKTRRDLESDSIRFNDKKDNMTFLAYEF